MLQNEYLIKEEHKGAPRSRSQYREKRGDFFLDGHRLSSLYRTTEPDRPKLMNCYPAASFLTINSAGVWGCKTPTRAI